MMRRSLVLALALLVLVSGAFALGRSGVTHARAGAASTPSAATEQRTHASPTEVGGPDPAEAAIAYATASQRWLYLTEDELTAELAATTTPASTDRLITEILRSIGEARAGLGASPGRVWWLVRPLAWHIDDQSATQARVSVWVVTVLSAVEVAAPQTEWMTVTVDLELGDGEWLLDDVTTSEGPTPINGPHDTPWDAEPFDDALEGFTRIDGERLW